MIWIEGVLFLASSLFLLRSSYEMFVLTPLYGPQMIFFSVLHTWPEKAIQVFFASWFAYKPFVYFAVLFALIRFMVGITRARQRTMATKPADSASLGPVRRLVGWLAGPPGYGWSVLIYAVAVLAAAHFGAAMTYDRWSEAIFQPRV